MKLIVGLGNPGRKYIGSRHNLGFEVLDQLAQNYATSKPKAKFQGEMVEAVIDGKKALLLSPHTYMNNSGQSVLSARDFYKLELDDLLIICDDLNLPSANLRFRSKGTAGGQNGLADVIRRLQTDEFSRLRIGIGSPPPHWDSADYVLGKFNKEELEPIKQAISTASEAVAVWTRHGTKYCMNHYNAN